MKSTNSHKNKRGRLDHDDSTPATVPTTAANCAFQRRFGYDYTTYSLRLQLLLDAYNVPHTLKWAQHIYHKEAVRFFSLNNPSWEKYNRNGRVRFTFKALVIARRQTTSPTSAESVTCNRARLLVCHQKRNANGETCKNGYRKHASTDTRLTSRTAA
jgi:hypothetical protein